VKPPIPDLVKEFISAAPVCRIATVRSAGTPHIIPVCPAFDGDATVYVDIARRGVSGRALETNQNVTVLIDEYDDDWSKLKAVILRCKAEALAGDEFERAWALFHKKFPQGDAIGWTARHSLALRILDWVEWGITKPLPYQPE
jgi:nitroimidazol reductase NimA-like FMN-containing flavoprotein (pyridoxamine 5'-phosphate oxidase superfamily)